MSYGGSSVMSSIIGHGISVKYFTKKNYIFSNEE